MREKRWKIAQCDPQKIESLQAALKINPVLCSLLVQRGIETFDEAKDFFRPSLSSLHSPFLMKDMQKAVDRIFSAMHRREKILVFGDYDVDGTTSVACMYDFLCRIYDKANLDFYVPHRYREGYGISEAGILHAYQSGVTLIICLDCGIKSVALIAYAKTLGIDFVVCDHHLPDETLPDAVAILNPKQSDCNYPFKELCGCGVGFKLICALSEKLGLKSEAPFKYLDLVATAIAADIVPVRDENRILAFYGLQKANKDPNTGIKALRFLSNIEKEIHISNLVFMIAPRVNAAGRMDDAKKAVQMFVAQDYEEALSYARLLHTDNSHRKEADLSITEEALSLIQSNTGWADKKSTVVFQSHWHKGVVGIVASRLIDHYYRPTIVLTQSGNYVAGSARSVAGFNVYEALHECKDLLLGYGGHFYAAGMTMELDKVDAFREKFEEVVASRIAPEMLVPEIRIDAEVSLSDLTAAFYRILCQMEPFGPDNLRPTFVIKNVLPNNCCLLKEQHIRFSLGQGLASFKGIAFNMSSKFPMLQMQKPVDIAFTLDENEWNCEKNLQLRVIDFRLSEPQ
jgi:single-stranded-DNA-specific exonuclease